MGDINIQVRTVRANWAEHAAEDVFADAVDEMSDYIGAVDVPDEVWRPLEDAIYALGTWVEAKADQIRKQWHTEGRTQEPRNA